MAGFVRRLKPIRQLDGYAQTLIVEEASNISTVDANDTTYLTVDFRVIVYA
jgi:hypothetical protein